MKETIKKVFKNEFVKIVALFALVLFVGIHFINKLAEYDESKRLAKVAEQRKIEETQDSIAYDLKKRQDAFADSISIVFMEEWNKVKDTEDFKNCRYTDFETRWSFGGNGYAFIVVVCDEVKNISNIGPFKPTFIVPTEVQKTVAHFKIYFNK